MIQTVLIFRINFTKRNSMWLTDALLYFLLYQFILTSAQPYHHSKVGEYYVEWKEIGPCPADKRGTNEIFTDFRLTRRHRKAELLGNLSVDVPFDDTTPLKMNFAILGSNLAWLPNAYAMTFWKGCSDFAGILGEGFTEYLKSFNMPPKCPMQKGFYRTKGYDPDNFVKNPLIPKQFIYGHYKLTLEYLSKKGTLLGCTYFILDIIPTWQKKKKQRNE